MKHNKTASKRHDSNVTDNDQPGHRAPTHAREAPAETPTDGLDRLREWHADASEHDTVLILDEHGGRRGRGRTNGAARMAQHLVDTRRRDASGNVIGHRPEHVDVPGVRR